MMIDKTLLKQFESTRIAIYEISSEIIDKLKEKNKVGRKKPTYYFNDFSVYCDDGDEYVDLTVKNGDTGNYFFEIRVPFTVYTGEMSIKNYLNEIEDWIDIRKKATNRYSYYKMIE